MPLDLSPASEGLAAVPLHLSSEAPEILAVASHVLPMPSGVGGVPVHQPSEPPGVVQRSSDEPPRSGVVPPESLGPSGEVPEPL